MIQLSIIIPCYNVAPYIGECISSLYKQGLSNNDFEVICVDDCSRDNTAESNPDAAVVAARIRKEPPVPFKTRIIWRIKAIIGENLYEWLHGRK